MCNRYIENILKILAIIIKKELTQRKTMATVKCRKNRVGGNITMQYHCSAVNRNWIKKKRRSGKSPTIRNLGENGKSDIAWPT